MNICLVWLKIDFFELETARQKIDDLESALAQAYEQDEQREDAEAEAREKHRRLQ